MDIKGSVTIEIAEIFGTTSGYLLNEGFSCDTMDEAKREILAILKDVKNEKLRLVALEQMRLLAAIEK